MERQAIHQANGFAITACLLEGEFILKERAVSDSMVEVKYGDCIRIAGDCR